MRPGDKAHVASVALLVAVSAVNAKFMYLCSGMFSKLAAWGFEPVGSPQKTLEIAPARTWVFKVLFSGASAGWRANPRSTRLVRGMGTSGVWERRSGGHYMCG